ncbi:hypothetical protein SKAU_G00213030 [Synaphobranchus kaupii]|uniref:Uncharacterized protein n=1 Tax=Synaphobranchus kaupii TaxID=118154 RepID=A0A9Q1F9U4_SYNKA|nr:hypothetical protein SKAU_G00213030 [Synaphobranchus kaupii]
MCAWAVDFGKRRRSSDTGSGPELPELAAPPKPQNSMSGCFPTRDPTCAQGKRLSAVFTSSAVPLPWQKSQVLLPCRWTPPPGTSSPLVPALWLMNNRIQSARLQPEDSLTLQGPTRQWRIVRVTR